MHGLCFAAWILLVCCIKHWGAWTWFGCCYSWCYGLLELYLDDVIQDVVSFVIWSWLELHIQFLYNIYICKVGLGFVFHIHFQRSNIYIFKFLHFEIHWDFGFFFHYLGIYFWNLLLELEFGFGWYFAIFILNELKVDKKKNKETKFEVSKRNKKIASKFWKAEYKLYWTFQYPKGTIDKNYKIRVDKCLKNTKKKIDWFYMVIENWLVLVFHVLFGAIPLTPMCKTNIQPLFYFCYMC
jgi:hypothetical protein